MSQDPNENNDKDPNNIREFKPKLKKPMKPVEEIPEKPSLHSHIDTKHMFREPGNIPKEKDRISASKVMGDLVADSAKFVGDVVSDTAKFVGDVVSAPVKLVGNVVTDTARFVGDRVTDSASAVKDEFVKLRNKILKIEKKQERISYYLMDRGKKVIVTEILDDMATQKIPFIREAFLEDLEKNGVELLTGVVYKEMTDKGLILTDNNGEERLIASDTIVLAAGSQAETKLFEEIKDKVNEVYKVGDCVEPRQIGEAVREGFDIGMNL